MRKVSLIIAPIVFILNWNSIAAQESDKSTFTEKGRIVLGTGAGASFAGVKIKDVDDQLFIFDVELNGGYFVVDHLAVGISSGYDLVKFGDDSNWSLNLGAFGRYYFKPGIFLGSGYIFSDSEDGENYGTVPLEIGYAHFFNRNIALEPEIELGIPGHNNDNFIYALSLGLGIYLR